MVSTFCCACIWYSISLPERRAGSPVQPSSRPEHREVDAALAQDVDQRERLLLDAVVVGARAADPQQVLGVGLVVERRDVLALGPVHALVGADAPRVAVALEVRERARQVRRHLLLHEHEVLPHLDDLLGWSMKTGQTSWQAPQVVHAHSTSSVVRPPMSGWTLSTSRRPPRAVLEAIDHHVERPAVGHARAHVVAHVVDDLHRRQRLAGVERRAEVRAARALGARVAVEQRLPREVLPLLHDAGGRDVVGLHVELGQHAALAELAEVDVGQRRQDVAVLRVEQVVQERQHDDARGATTTPRTATPARRARQAARTRAVSAPETG